MGVAAPLVIERIGNPAEGVVQAFEFRLLERAAHTGYQPTASSRYSKCHTAAHHTRTSASFPSSIINRQSRSRPHSQPMLPPEHLLGSTRVVLRMRHLNFYSHWFAVLSGVFSITVTHLFFIQIPHPFPLTSKQTLWRFWFGLLSVVKRMAKRHPARHWYCQELVLLLTI
jgi:hypothetical protein